MSATTREGIDGIDRRRFLQTAGAPASAGGVAGFAGIFAGRTDAATETPTLTATPAAGTGDADPARIGVSLLFTGFMAEEGPPNIARLTDDGEQAIENGLLAGAMGRDAAIEHLARRFDGLRGRPQREIEDPRKAIR